MPSLEEEWRRLLTSPLPPLLAAQQIQPPEPRMPRPERPSGMSWSYSSPNAIELSRQMESQPLANDWPVWPTQPSTVEPSEWRMGNGSTINWNPQPINEEEIRDFIQEAHRTGYGMTRNQAQLQGQWGPASQEDEREETMAPTEPISDEVTLVTENQPIRRASMTKRHFDAIAAAVHRISGFNIREEVAEALIPALEQFNRSFDPVRFREACGVPSTEMGRLAARDQSVQEERRQIQAFQRANPLPPEIQTPPEVRAAVQPGFDLPNTMRRVNLVAPRGRNV